MEEKEVLQDSTVGMKTLDKSAYPVFYGRGKEYKTKPVGIKLFWAIQKVLSNVSQNILVIQKNTAGGKSLNFDETALAIFASLGQTKTYVYEVLYLATGLSEERLDNEDAFAPDDLLDLFLILLAVHPDITRMIDRLLNISDNPLVKKLQTKFKKEELQEKQKDTTP